MLGIIILDDDIYTVRFSAELINGRIAAHSLPAEIVCKGTSFAELELFLKHNGGSYLYFLDIDFGKEKLNGLDIARKIRQLEPLSKIVFVTSHEEMGIKVLKSGIEPFGFIEKRFQQKDMAADYRKYIELAVSALPIASDKPPSGEGFIKLCVGIDEYLDLDISRILYVESAKTISHFVCYHSLDGSSISVRDTIESVLSRLGSGFMKSHRSVIINKSYVVGVSDGCVNFSNGESAACSFRLKNEVVRLCLTK